MASATILQDKEIIDLTSFKFVKLKIPDLIPYELIENVKGRTFTPEQFYKYQNQQVSNPYNFLYALIDEVSRIQGFLWAEQNMLDRSLFINTFSITKECWHKGKAIAKVTEFLRDLKAKTKAEKVFWATTNGKFFKKHGFKESKIKLMEYSEDS
jgi:hypothetical protein